MIKRTKIVHKIAIFQSCKIKKIVMKFQRNFSAVLYKMSLAPKMQWERTEKSGEGVVQMGEGKKAIKKSGKPPEIQGKRA